MNLNWAAFQAGDWLIGLVSTLVVYVPFTILQHYILHRDYFLRTIAIQLNLLVLALLALLFLTPELYALHSYVFSAVQTTAVFLFMVIIIRAVDVLFFDRLRRWRHQTPVPAREGCCSKGRWGSGACCVQTLHTISRKPSQ